MGTLGPTYLICGYLDLDPLGLETSHGAREAKALLRSALQAVPVVWVAVKELKLSYQYLVM